MAFARKTADEPVTSSTALQDDDHLLLAVGANEVWEFDMTLYVTGDVGGDLALTVAGPAGSAERYGAIAPWTRDGRGRLWRCRIRQQGAWSG